MNSTVSHVQCVSFRVALGGPAGAAFAASANAVSSTRKERLDRVERPAKLEKMERLDKVRKARAQEAKLRRDDSENPLEYPDSQAGVIAEAVRFDAS